MSARTRLAALVLVPLALGACAEGSATVAASPPALRASAASIPARLADDLAGLTPAQLAGQRIVYSYSGPTPPRSLLARIRRAEAAGVIFFAPNVVSRRALRRVTRELDRAAAASPLPAPLLLMTDQEGGQVRRLAGEPRLSEKQIGASGDGRALAAAAGSGAARNLAGVGLNVNLAPVLDVYRTPGNFIDEYERSYSSNPARVGDLGAAFIKAQQAGRVAATAKHFPGLGAATAEQNTDEGPVTLSQPLATIRNVDEAPYRAAIAAGVRLVMLSWAVYPALDPTLPAGLSPRIVQGELRSRLGFRGVTITDSIGAGALAPVGTTARRALLAARAGDDLILCSGQSVALDGPAIGVAALRSLAGALGDGELSRSGARRAAEAVLRLRLHP